MLLCLNSKNKLVFEVRIQLLSVARPAMNDGLVTFGRPAAQLENWTLVPSYHFIWVSAAQRKEESITKLPKKNKKKKKEEKAVLLQTEKKKGKYKPAPSLRSPSHTN